MERNYKHRGVSFPFCNRGSEFKLLLLLSTTGAGILATGGEGEREREETKRREREREGVSIDSSFQKAPGRPVGVSLKAWFCGLRDWAERWEKEYRKKQRMREERGKKKETGVSC
jgi:hypothetical protein